MARTTGVKTRAGRNAPRPAPKPAAVSPAAPPVARAEPPQPKPKVTAGQFAEQVRGEARKITWPTWKETWITSVMVFVMVVAMSVFFLVVDGGLSFLGNQFMKLAG
jgi:preprotein translocase subunit SecE